MTASGECRIKVVRSFLTRRFREFQRQLAMSTSADIVHDVPALEVVALEGRVLHVGMALI